MTESKMKDVYDGKYISCWKDQNLVFISFPWCTINFFEKDFPEVIEELSDLKKALKSKRKRNKASSKGQLWERQIDEILNTKDVSLSEEKRNIFLSHYNGSSVSIPSDKCQFFFAQIFNELLLEHALSEVLVKSFKMGQVYQLHKDELEK